VVKGNHLNQKEKMKKPNSNVLFILNYIHKNPGATRVQILTAHQIWKGKPAGWLASSYMKPALSPGHYYYTLYSQWKSDPENWCMKPEIEFGETNQSFLRMGWGGYTTAGFRKYFVNAENRCYVDKLWTKVGKGWELTQLGKDLLGV
jgi:hypothetical protein